MTHQLPAATVARAVAGDEDARDALARSCQRAAFLFALQLTGSREDARDVSQEALLRVFRSLGSYDLARPLRPWLLRIVANLVRDRARRRRVRQAEVLTADAGAALAEPADPAADPEARATRRELQAAVWAAVQRLQPDHREVLVLRDYQDLAYDEIAATLGVPRGTVMSRLHRARLRLRDLVAPALSGGKGEDHG